MGEHGRHLVAKTLQLTGLVLVGMALFIGLDQDDMGRELLALGLGTLVFLAGYAVEKRP